MGLDYQAHAFTRIEIDASGASGQQLDGVELVRVVIVVLGRHRGSPGYSQKPSKDAILTDLAREINSQSVCEPGNRAIKQVIASSTPAARL